jgi:alpha-galactosidase
LAAAFSFVAAAARECTDRLLPRVFLTPVSTSPGPSLSSLGMRREWTRLCLVAGSFMLSIGAPEGSAAALHASGFSPGGGIIRVEADGFTGWSGVCSARVVVAGQELELDSSTGNPVATTAAAETEMTPEGAASVTARTIEFPEHQVRLVHRLGRLPGTSTLLMQTGITNCGTQAIQLVSVTPMRAEFAVSVPHEDWWITALNDSVQTAPSVTLLARAAQPVAVFENGGFYRSDGAGFLFGPVGSPVAYVNARFAVVEGGRVAFSCTSDMSRVRVDPGETRWGQQTALLLEPPRRALARWSEWVAVSHGARTRQGSVSGWNSWQFLGGQVSGKDVLAVVDSARKAPGRLRPAVIQIDGGYEDPSGARDSNTRFPEGLEFYSKQIASIGARPGLLLESVSGDGFFIPWEKSAQHARDLAAKGYSYFKLNTQRITGYTPGNERQTSFEVMRDGFASIRNAVGEDVYLLNNDLKPNRAALGHVDAHRIGAESKRDLLRPVFDDVLRCFAIQNRWGSVDTDAYFLGTDLENVSSIAGGWPIVRTWTSMVGLSCGNAITSDPWYLECFKPLLRNVETMTPPAQERTEVLDLCTAHEFPRLIGHVEREWGRMAVALLWNPGTTERTVTLDFDKAGLSSRRRYAVWSFWDDRFLGVAKGSWTTPSLAPSASQHLRFTDLDQTPDRPVLIGSNLHIYCGAAEIERVTSLQGGMEIELTDAGARDGDLFVYSRLTPVLKSATGCTVNRIAYAGENVWRIAVQNRRPGEPQRVEMSIQLPVWKQPWFWCLVALAAASLLFAAWRYLAGLRLEREHALQQERSRIAQDLHDNIGANLAQIGLLTEQVEQAIDDPDEMRVQLDRIFRVSHATAKELDTVVWAVDPSNDTLEEFARYVHGYAEDYLAMAGVRCHFTTTGSMPEIHLSARLRHHLLMVVKEALHNVVEHAAASLVTLSIGMVRQGIRLEIADDGRGLPAAVAMPAGNGLHNMRKRAAEVGGTCEFLHPMSGKGTIVLLTVPVKA